MVEKNKHFEIHPWEPYIPKDAKIIFLGTFPPKAQKWGMNFYYPNKINDFWRILGKIFHGDYSHFIDKETNLFNKEKIIATLDLHKIAIADIAVKVYRQKDNASDKYLEIIDTLDLIGILSKTPSCKYIVATGQKSAETIAMITDTAVPKIGDSTKASINNHEIKIYRMPSTSRAYPLAIDKKTELYHQLFFNTEIL